MSILVTGAAADVIGSHVRRRLAERGDQVIGVDNLNDYYDPALKQTRLAQLQAHANFAVVEGDIAASDVLAAVCH